MSSPPDQRPNLREAACKNSGAPSTALPPLERAEMRVGARVFARHLSHARPKRRLAQSKTLAARSTRLAVVKRWDCSSFHQSL
jgi:hypothetical protein